VNENESFLPSINPERCNGCGDCARVCPSGALELQAGLAVLVSPDNCAYCADCEEHCPTDAINLPYEIVVDSAVLVDETYVP
jgi:NAD-dependent dihydropyrimidine dehydrogenase PreA subunit